MNRISTANDVTLLHSFKEISQNNDLFRTLADWTSNILRGLSDIFKKLKNSEVRKFNHSLSIFAGAIGAANFFGEIGNTLNLVVYEKKHSLLLIAKTVADLFWSFTDVLDFAQTTHIIQFGEKFSSLLPIISNFYGVISGSLGMGLDIKKLVKLNHKEKSLLRSKSKCVSWQFLDSDIHKNRYLEKIKHLKNYADAFPCQQPNLTKAQNKLSAINNGQFLKLSLNKSNKKGILERKIQIKELKIHKHIVSLLGNTAMALCCSVIAAVSIAALFAITITPWVAFALVLTASSLSLVKHISNAFYFNPQIAQEKFLLKQLL